MIRGLSFKPQVKGEVTVFLSLIFVLMLSFILAMLDGVLLQTAKGDYRLAADLAIFSAFGEYQLELLEEYGIFALEGSYEGGDYDERNLLGRMAYFGAAGIEQNIESIQLLTDNNGQAFREQVLYYMEEKFGISYVVDILGLEREWNQQEIDGEQAFKDEEGILSDLAGMLEDEEVAMPMEDNPIAHVAGLREQSLLSLVMPEENPLSTLGISTENHASKRTLRTGRGEFPSRENTSGVEQRLLYQEYLLGKFDYATSKLDDEDEESSSEHQRNLAYEIEYILEGQGSDIQNLERVVAKILLIRMGTNLVHLKADKEKMNQVRTMATALSALIKMPGIAKGFELAIVLAWAFGESIMDIRALMEGNKVAIIKTKDSWQLTLTNLLKLGTQEDRSSSRDDEKGMSYEDYLRVFLFMSNTNRVTMRTIDRVEQNMIVEQEKDFFRADNCISKVRVNNRATIRNDITYDFPLYFSYL
jgi:hypothetical protein